MIAPLFFANVNQEIEPWVFVIIGLVIVLMVGAVVVQRHLAKKRRQAIGAVARQLGLRFHPERNYDVGRKMQFLDALRGSNRYAFNMMDGSYKDYPVSVFDFHYETKTTNSKGQRRRRHHYLSLFVCRLPRHFAELRIHKEGFLDKVVDSIGFNDIEFESAEFSRMFSVRSKDKKFAYDFVNPQMMTYLMSNPELAIEVEHDILCVYFKRRLDPAILARTLDRLIDVRTRMPDYLFDH